MRLRLSPIAAIICTSWAALVISAGPAMAQSNALPGSVDLSFNPGRGHHGTDGSVRAVAVQSDRRVLIGGQFTDVGGLVRRGIARLEADGAVDLSFAPAGIDDYILPAFYEPDFNTTSVRAIALQSDGKIVVGGEFHHFNGSPVENLVRLRSDGSLDPLFSVTITNINGGISRVRTLALDREGRILVGGQFSSVNSHLCTSLARLQTNGQLDLSFQPVLPNDAAVHSILVQEDGNIVIGGSFEFVNGLPHRHLARLLTNGAVDLTFQPGAGPDGKVHALAADAKGGLLVGGAFANFSGATRPALVRLSANGALDNSFASNVVFHIFPLASVIQAITIDSEGSILIGGSFYSWELPLNLGLLGINGTPMNHPAAGADRPVLALAALPSGGFIVGGDIFSPMGILRRGFVRLDQNGDPDPSFTPGTGVDGSVHAIAAEPDGGMLVGGYFQSFGRKPCLSLARLNSTGAWDETFTNGSDVVLVEQIFRCADGKYVIGGQTSTAESLGDDIVRLDSHGSIDATFVRPDFSRILIEDMALAGDGSVIAAGRFDIASVPRYSVIRLAPDGAFVNGLPYNPDFEPQQVAVEPDGAVLVLGSLQFGNDYYEARVYRLLSNGNIDATFNPPFESLPVHQYYQLGRQPDGRVLIGGFGAVAFPETAPTFQIQRFLASGEPDPTYAGTAPNSGPFLVSRLGRLFVARLEVDRLEVSGAIDPTFASGYADVQIECIEEDSQGRLLVGGRFQNFGGVQRAFIVRLHNGQLEPGKPIYRDGPYTTFVTWGEELKLDAVFAAAPAADYRWYHGQDLIHMTGQPRLRIPAVTSAEAGGYFVTASNAFGVTTSQVAMVFVQSGVKVLLDPTPRLQTVGDTVTFDAMVYGRPPLSLQWFGSQLIPGATSSQLTLTNVSFGDAGEYFLLVSNGVTTRMVATELKITFPIFLGEVYLPNPSTFYFSVSGYPLTTIRVQHSVDLVHWTTASYQTIPAFGRTDVSVPRNASPNAFFRVQTVSAPP